MVRLPPQPFNRPHCTYHWLTLLTINLNYKQKIVQMHFNTHMNQIQIDIFGATYLILFPIVECTISTQPHRSKRRPICQVKRTKYNQLKQYLALLLMTSYYHSDTQVQETIIFNL